MEIPSKIERSINNGKSLGKQALYFGWPEAHSAVCDIAFSNESNKCPALYSQKMTEAIKKYTVSEYIEKWKSFYTCEVRN